MQSQIGSFTLSERKTRENSQEYCLPFILDGYTSGPGGSPSSSKESIKKSVIAFSPDSNVAVRKYSSKCSPGPRNNEIVGFSLGNRRLSEGSGDTRRKVMDSLESIDQDYVIVSGSALELSSPSEHSFKPSQSSSFIAGSPPVESTLAKSRTSALVPLTGIETGRVGYTERLESPTISTPGNPQGTMDIPNPSDQPSTDSMTRIKSLKRCALAISEIVHDKVEKGKQLEGLSVQLVVLAIWKQALHICHTHAASAIEGYPNQETRLRYASNSDKYSIDNTKIEGPQDVCLWIESAFLQEIEKAEVLAKVIDAGSGEMPDAMELIYRSALDWGADAGVNEFMYNNENAVVFYSKAVRLLQFFPVEATSHSEPSILPYKFGPISHSELHQCAE